MTLVRCKRCVMPSTRPDTEWKDGICSACLNHEAQAGIDWVDRECDIVNLIEAAPPNGSGFDCIVASSGGKDSTWQTLKLLELGAKPLVVTARTCMQTALGGENIANLARFAETHVVEYDPDVRRKLNVLGQDLVGDISWPEHVAIFSAPFRASVEHGIPLVFYGECPQNAYGGPLEAASMRRMTKAWIHEFGGHLGFRASDMVGKAGITKADMEIYQLPEDVDAKVNAYFMGAFLPWDSHTNADVAIRNGMQIRSLPPCPANWWKFENLDNAMTGLHDFFGYLKFGYGRLCAQISVDIRYGLISREDAMFMVGRRDGDFPYAYMGVYLDEVLRHLNVTEGWLMDSVRRYVNQSLFGSVRNRRPMLWEFEKEKVDG